MGALKTIPEGAVNKPFDSEKISIIERNDPQLSCKILLIGGSAGSLEVIMRILPALDPGFSFAIVIILRGTTANSFLPQLLSLQTRLPIREVVDKDIVEQGTIFLAPANHQLSFEKTGLFSVSPQNIIYSSPAIDALFESAAEVYGNSVVALLLSGANADGTKGLLRIQNTGGRVCIQDPASASDPFMPQHACAHLVADSVLLVNEMPWFIRSLNKGLKIVY